MAVVIMFDQALTIMDFAELKIKWIKLQTKFKLILTCDWYHFAAYSVIVVLTGTLHIFYV